MPAAEAVAAPADAPVDAPAADAPVPDAPVARVKRVDPWAHRRGEPRTFAALWLVYLAGAAAVSLGAGGSLGLFSTDVYRASARILLVIAGVGLGVLWPMVRLSQELPARGNRSAWQDVVVVALPLQAVAWPQALPWMAGWPLAVAGAVAAAYTAWAVLLGGVLACCYALLRAGVVRGRATLMAGVMVVVGAGPLLGVVAGREGELRGAPDADVWLALSPVTGAWEMARDRTWSGFAARVTPAHWWAIAGVVGAGVCAWGAAGIAARRADGRGTGRAERGTGGVAGGEGAA